MRRLAMVSEGMSLAFPLSQVAIQEAVCSELHGQAWRGILLKLLPPPPHRHYKADFAIDIIGSTELCKPRLCLDFGLLSCSIGTLDQSKKRSSSLMRRLAMVSEGISVLGFWVWVLGFRVLGLWASPKPMSKTHHCTPS